jgi:predicted nucleic acid-binding protein
MEARFLLDTNICIYIRRNKPEQVLRRLPNTASWPGRALGHYPFGELA